MIAKREREFSYLIFEEKIHKDTQTHTNKRTKHKSTKKKQNENYF